VCRSADKLAAPRSNLYEKFSPDRPQPQVIPLCIHGVDGFEGIVLEDLLTDFIPEVFLRIEFRRVRRQEQHCDIARNREVAAAMVGSSIEDQEDILPDKPSRQDIEEALEARGFLSA
jgi:hypothetical protein